MVAQGDIIDIIRAGTSSYGSRSVVWWNKPSVRHATIMLNEGTTYRSGDSAIVTQTRFALAHRLLCQSHDTKVHPLGLVSGKLQVNEEANRPTTASPRIVTFRGSPAILPALAGVGMGTERRAWDVFWDTSMCLLVLASPHSQSSSRRRYHHVLRHFPRFSSRR